MPRTVKVAIIGSGLAGLTSAYMLSTIPLKSEVEIEVHLFEKASEVGMDVSSVSLPPSEGMGEWRVDVPMRSFQGGYYPQLISLYKRLGVAFRRADFSYSFSSFLPSTNLQAQKITAHTIYNGLSGRAGISMPSALHDHPYAVSKEDSLLAGLFASAFAYGAFCFIALQLAWNYLRLLALTLPLTRPTRVPEMTFREWADSTAPDSIAARWIGLDASWHAFVQQILVPLFSAVCTAPAEDVMDHPAEEFLDYIWLTLGTHHYVVMNGVRDVVARLSAHIPHIHLASPIISLSQDAQCPHLVTVQCTGNIAYTGFSHIIFATQANHAVPLLRSYASSLPAASSALDAQIRCLQSLTYRPTIVINHTDPTLMPDSAHDRRNLNLISAAASDVHSTCETNDRPAHCVSQSYTMATHVLHKGDTASASVFQTTNPLFPPRQDTILSVAHLERAVLTLDAKRALRGLYSSSATEGGTTPGLGPLQGAGKSAGVRLGESVGAGIWFVGSYAAGGIPLLEGCVVSARNVVEKGVLASEGVPVVESPW
ncbi:hypothetical protein PLICRDRAFT_114713 [Plicaturopsis crispa FD-325 SS-3]|nr:hypothetical protein PLICRDRAFT_114713 [Plicaturopsis crispa FD-325 SS-3]